MLYPSFSSSYVLFRDSFQCLFGRTFLQTHSSDFEIQFLNGTQCDGN